MCVAAARAAPSSTLPASDAGQIDDMRLETQILERLGPSRPAARRVTNTTRDCGCLADGLQSSMVRYTKQSGRSRPGTGGTKGYEPVAMTA